MPLDIIHIIIGIGTIAVTAFLAYIGMKIKLEVVTGGSKILETQNKIAAALDTHVKLDDMKHSQIDKHFEATDGRVDKLEDRKWDRYTR